MFSSNKNFQKGSALYLAVVILSITLSITLGMGTILILQMRAIRDTFYSTNAYYVAETGIEQGIFLSNYDCFMNNQCEPTKVDGDNDGNNDGEFEGEINGSKYSVKITKEGETILYKSIGDYKGAKRIVEYRQSSAFTGESE
ncbi:MAG TPA: pilus assembly PilX N-terminal domain-containing protein [Candidatus Pacearchaeota archaeon]|nr:pilus assembly PilX N-terminal domain-containing protein [Candidatus Pacearchaeota archaeon]HPO68628.1 pilus assembly PilX N-terminal domain-containing protein [Candidatus Pacearchaeota archaeon]